MYNSLHASRGIAAIFVVLFHLGGAIGVEKYFNLPILTDIFAFGRMGVVYFFVLSGFIIYTAHYKEINNPSKIKNYIYKRFIRIYPTYWIIFLSVFLAAHLSTSLASTMPNDLIVILKSLLLIPQDKQIVGGTGAPVIIVAWSLQYEMMFYFIFGLFIFNKKSGYLFLLMIFVYFIFATLALDNDVFILRFILNPYFSLFVFGMITAKIIISKKHINLKSLSSKSLFLFCSLIFLSIIISSTNDPKYNLLLLLAIGIVSAALIRANLSP